MSLGIIAGAGDLPRAVAESARADGFAVFHGDVADPRRHKADAGVVLRGHRQPLLRTGWQLVKRLRVGKQRTGAELWSYARSVITDPSADREVWLVLGAALSASAVRDAVDNPTPELIQIYALLQTAWGAISQTGARLRVFCSP